MYTEINPEDLFNAFFGKSAWNEVEVALAKGGADGCRWRYGWESVRWAIRECQR
jgi:hypothetical protein